MAPESPKALQSTVTGHISPCSACLNICRGDCNSKVILSQPRIHFFPSQQTNFGGLEEAHGTRTMLLPLHLEAWSTLCLSTKIGILRTRFYLQVVRKSYARAMDLSSLRSRPCTRDLAGRCYTTRHHSDLILSRVSRAISLGKGHLSNRDLDEPHLMSTSVIQELLF